MKRFVLLLTILVAAICVAPSFSSGSEPLEPSKPWNRILSSKAALQSFCLENSSRAYIGIWGTEEVLAIPDANQYVWVYNSNPLILIESVTAQELGIGIVAGSDPYISKHCVFYDSRYRVMYHGYAEGRVVQTGDSKSLAWKDLVMRIPEWLEIDLPPEYEHASVYLKYIDSNGYYRYEYLGGNQSSFHFPTAFTGLDGARLIMRGQTHDGFNLDQVVYLSTGDFLPHDEFFENHQHLTIEGIVYSTDKLVHIIESENSVGENPLFQVASTGTKLVTFSAQTSEGEIPTGFFYRMIGQDGDWSEWIRLDYHHGEQYELPLGTYHIYFEWEHFRSNKWMEFQNWNYHGGKG